MCQVKAYMLADEALRSSGKEAPHLMTKSSRKQRRNEPPGRKPRSPPPPWCYTSLNPPHSEVLNYIREEGYAANPPPMKSKPSDSRQKDLYFRFHRDYGHDTEVCFSLKDEIKQLISKGHPYRFIAKGSMLERVVWDKREKETHHKNSHPQQPQKHEPLARVIHVILGGLAVGETSHSGRKKYGYSINTIETPRNKLRFESPISFNDEDMRGVIYPHSDKIMITLNIGGIEVRRFLGG